MPDDITPAGPVVPAVIPPVAPVVAPPAVVVAPPVAPVVTAPVVPSEPDWLPDRLKRHEATVQAALLKELGVDDPAAAKQAIADAKAAAEAKKTAEQRAAELDAKLKGSQTESEKQAALIKEHAGRMLMALTADQQKAVSDFAGDNPSEQLRAIHHFAPLWAKAESDAATRAAAATPVATVTAPPANTSPAPIAPSSVTPGSPPDAAALYTSARTRNPFAAAAYAQANPQAYETKP